MPLSQAGKHFSNPARARMQDAMDAPAPSMGDADDSGEQSIEVKQKPDGSICTVEDGQEMEHPDLESALSAVQQKFGGDEQMGQSDPGDENDQY